MKKCFALVVAGLLLFSSAWSQEKNADTLLRKAFMAISKKDKAAYLKLFPDYKEFKEMFDKMLAHIKDSSMKKEIANQYNKIDEANYGTEVLAKIEEDFNDFLEELSKKGIDPAKLSFTSAKYEVVNSDEVYNFVKALKGQILAKDEKQEYEIGFSDVIWSDHAEGWFGVSLRNIRKKGQEEEKEVIDGTDVKVETIQQEGVKDEMMPPPPPPPPPKKKTEVKKKTTTPVKKTKTSS